jgi:hypothetical protein
MNHLISQEWQEIRLRIFLNMIFDARAFECDTFWICKLLGLPKIYNSTFIFSEKWTWYSKSLEALTFIPPYCWRVFKLFCQNHTRSLHFLSLLWVSCPIQHSLSSTRLSSSTSSTRSLCSTRFWKAKCFIPPSSRGPYGDFLLDTPGSWGALL